LFVSFWKCENKIKSHFEKKKVNDFLEILIEWLNGIWGENGWVGGVY
jgi:hypothetical protein